MSKSILVIDTPENCWNCKLQDWANCRIVKGCHVGATRPDWCPLKPMPEKKNQNGRVVGDYLRGRADGHNALLDYIGGVNEEHI